MTPHSTVALAAMVLEALCLETVEVQGLVISCTVVQPLYRSPRRTICDSVRALEPRSPDLIAQTSLNQSLTMIKVKLRIFVDEMSDLFIQLDIVRC